MFRKLENAYRKIVWTGMILAGLSLLLMMAYGFVDVAGRSLFNTPLPATIEFTELLMPILGLMGVAACQLERRHMRVDFLFGYMSTKTKQVLEIISYLLGILSFSLLFWLTLKYALYSFESREYAMGVIPFPIYVAKIAVAIGILLFIIQVIFDLINAVKSLRESNGELVESASSELPIPVIE